jgi:GNAT superfamily N-acetyltransferase
MGAMTGSPNGLEIRRAVPDDTPAIHALVQAGFGTYRAFAPAGWAPPDEPHGLELDAARAELSDPATFCLIAEDGGAMVGTVRLVRGRSASRDGIVPDRHLKHLFVAESHWGTGLAGELHAAAMAALPPGALARLFTPALQARARRFYEREGWSLHGAAYFEPLMGLDLVEYRRRAPGGRSSSRRAAPR